MKIKYDSEDWLVVHVSESDLTGPLLHPDPAERYITTRTPDGIGVRLQVSDRPEMEKEPSVTYIDGVIKIDVSQIYFDQNWRIHEDVKANSRWWSSDEFLTIPVNRKVYAKN